MKKTIMLLLPVLLLSGCIVKETHHTLYLSPDGQVEWTVMLTNAHSDAANPLEQATEEAKFLADFPNNQDNIQLGLLELGPAQTKWRILREKCPYEIRLEASYSSLECLAQSLLDRLGVPGQARLWREGNQMHFDLECNPALEQSVDSQTGDHLFALADDPDNQHLVLTRGRFIQVDGFKLVNPVCVSLDTDSLKPKVESKQPLHLSLTWTTDENGKNGE